MNKTIQEGFDNNNSKPFWRYVKTKRLDNVDVAPLKVKGVLHGESKNSRFSLSSFTLLSQKMKKYVLSKLSKQFKHELAGHTITVPHQLAPGLSEIFQNSVDSGKLPTGWTNANILCSRKEMYISRKIIALSR